MNLIFIICNNPKCTDWNTANMVRCDGWNVIIGCNFMAVRRNLPSIQNGSWFLFHKTKFMRANRIGAVDDHTYIICSNPNYIDWTTANMVTSGGWNVIVAVISWLHVET